MHRFFTEVHIDEKTTKYRVRLEDVESEAQQVARRQSEFLMEVANQPELLTCGYARPQTVKFYHNGIRWVAEAEAVVEHEQ